jgi:hypothetical protein
MPFVVETADGRIVGLKSSSTNTNTQASNRRWYSTRISRDAASALHCLRTVEKRALEKNWLWPSRMFVFLFAVA